MRSPSTKVWVSLICVLALLAGMILGAVGGFYFAVQFQGELAASMTTDHMLTDALMHFRSAKALAPGDSEGVRQSILYALVDDLPVLQALCLDRVSVGRTGACALLQEDARYLKAHPWSTEVPEFDAMLSDIVAHADENAATVARAGSAAPR